MTLFESRRRERKQSSRERRDSQSNRRLTDLHEARFRARSHSRRGSSVLGHRLSLDETLNVVNTIIKKNQNS